jgi:hypothetical protein
MASRLIGISYTPQGGGQVYSLQLNNFGDNSFPRSYVDSVQFDLSANGTNIMGGPAYSQKYQWVISSLVQAEDALTFDELYRDWDADRAQGLAAAVGIIDQTFGPPVNTSAVFVTAPRYTYTSPRLTLVSFGLREV